MAKEEDAFLVALREDPESSDPREVYADWLEERGRSDRAEYVRLEAEVRAFDFITGNPEREQKKARRDELEDEISKRDPTWLANVSRIARVPAKHPRPTGEGKAETIPTKAETAPTSVRFKDGLPTPAPLDARSLPMDPAKKSFLRRFAFEILIAVVLAFLIKDVTTKGFFERLIEDIYIRGHP